MPRVRKKKQQFKAAQSPHGPQQQGGMTTPASAASASSTSSPASKSKLTKGAEQQHKMMESNTTAANTSSSSNKPGPITRSKAEGGLAATSKQSTRQSTRVAPPETQQQATSSISARSGGNRQSSTPSNSRVGATTTLSDRQHSPAVRQVAETKDEEEDEEDGEDSDASTSSEEEQEDRSNFGFPLFGPNSAISTCLRKIKELDELSRKNKAAAALQSGASTSGIKAPQMQGQLRKEQAAGNGSTSGYTAQRGPHIKTEPGEDSMPSSSKRQLGVSGGGGSERSIKKEGQQGIHIKKEIEDDEDMHSDMDEDGEQSASDEDHSDASTSSDDSRTGTPDPAGAKAEMLRNMMRDAMGMNHDLVDRIRLDTIQRLREQLANTRDLASRYNVTLAQASEDERSITTAMRYMRTILTSYQRDRRSRGGLTYHQQHVQKMARVGLMELERAVEKDRRWEGRRRRGSGGQA